MSNEIELQNIAIWGNSFVDDFEEIKDVLDRIADLAVPDSLGNQIISIDEDHVEASLIAFSDGGLAQPDQTAIPAGKHNFLLFTVQEDDLAFSADIDPDFVDDFVGVFDEVLSEVDLHITGFNINFELDPGFDDLELSIEGPSDFNFDGVRFNDGNFSFIVQAHYGGESQAEGHELEHTDESQSNSNEVGEAGGQTTKRTVSDVTTIEHFDVSDSGEFIRTKVEQAQETLEEITP